MMLMIKLEQLIFKVMLCIRQFQLGVQEANKLQMVFSQFKNPIFPIESKNKQ